MIQILHYIPIFRYNYIHQNLIHQQRILHPLLYLSRYHRNKKNSVVVNALKAKCWMLQSPELCYIYAYVPHTNNGISDFNQIKKIRYEPLSINNILKCLFCLKIAVFLIDSF